MTQRRNKIALYTANIGGYDPMVEFITKDPEIDYHMFTDVARRSTFWHVNKIKREKGVDARMTARAIKCLPHLYLPDYPVTIWADCKFHQIASVMPLIKHLLTGLKIMEHPTRYCIYEESNAVKKLKFDNPRVVDAQMSRYRRDGFPSGMGLCATGIIIRKNLSPINKLNEFWYDEIVKGSGRDQLSFNYCCWKLGVKYTTFAYSDQHKYFNAVPHSKKRPKM